MFKTWLEIEIRREDKILEIKRAHQILYKGNQNWSIEFEVYLLSSGELREE